MAVRLYCGVSDEWWNRRPVRPGRYACVSPVYGASVATKRENRVNLPAGTLVLQDSGAFSDGPGERLDFAAALARQLDHSVKFGYETTHRASYDLLIDEMWLDGVREKGRWSEAEAAAAVDETIAAADYMRCHYEGRRVLSVQGVTVDQYMACARAIIPMLEDGDMLGLGGWCVCGKFPAQMMPVFSETMRQLIPYAAREGVRRVHIWGVMDSDFLGRLAWLCDRYGLKLSTDSVGPQVRPGRGQWGYKGWINPHYRSADLNVRGLHRVIHVKLTRCWLRYGLANSSYYREPDRFPVQGSLIGG